MSCAPLVGKVRQKSRSSCPTSGDIHFGVRSARAAALLDQRGNTGGLKGPLDLLERVAVEVHQLAGLRYVASSANCSRENLRLMLWVEADIWVLLGRMDGLLTTNLPKDPGVRPSGLRGGTVGQILSTDSPTMDRSRPATLKGADSGAPRCGLAPLPAEMGRGYLAQATLPCSTQKCDWHPAVRQTEGCNVGRPRASTCKSQRGLTCGNSINSIVSPQPHGHRIPADHSSPPSIRRISARRPMVLGSSSPSRSTTFRS
jgi:hypothetical protein